MQLSNHWLKKLNFSTAIKTHHAVKFVSIETMR